MKDKINISEYGIKFRPRHKDARDKKIRIPKLERPTEKVCKHCRGEGVIYTEDGEYEECPFCNYE